jgi:hypothetical protein
VHILYNAGGWGQKWPKQRCILCARDLISLFNMKYASLWDGQHGFFFSALPYGRFLAAIASNLADPLPFSSNLHTETSQASVNHAAYASYVTY